MSASYLSPVQLFSSCLKLCGPKFNRVNALYSRSFVNISCRLKCGRNALGPLAHRSLYLCPPDDLWSRSVSQTTAVPTNELTSDSAVNESTQMSTKPFLKPMRKDRLEQQSLFRQIILSKGEAPWTDDDWQQVADSLSVTGQESWEVLCMHTLYVDKNISLARSLMAYLEKHRDAVSLIAVTFYIGLLGETCTGSDTQQEETYRYYTHLLSRTSVLDAASIEVLISGLSSTKYYLECLKLLKTCQETSNPSITSLMQLLRATVRNHDMDVCHDVLSELGLQMSTNTGTASLPKVIEEGLSSNNQQGLEAVMNFMRRHSLLMKRTELEQVASAFHRYQPNQWMANYGFIHHRTGRCTVCGHQMKKLEIDSNDFQSIQSTFLDQVIIGSNVFFKSSPKEVNSFIRFVEKNGPFDVVIDGLNVIYRNARKPDLTQVEKVVEYFTSQGKRVLLVGNSMLTPGKSHNMKLEPRPAVYITSTSRTDDAFFLYAALHSGKQTLVVSSDKLRDHKFLLSPSLRPIFHTWVLSAQVYDWHITKSGHFVIGKRHLYETGPANDDGGWHIPENDITVVNPFGNFGVLCLRNKTNLSGSLGTDTNNKSYRQTHNKRPQQNVAIPGPDKTCTHRGPDTAKSSDTHNKREKEWFDS
ncbi:hypothetical protein BsWGS_15206 [Bradybaena similaris]